MAATAILCGLVLGAGDPTSDLSRAEALTGLRAKVKWEAVDPLKLPSSITSRQNADPNSQDISPFAVFRDATITRQTNPFSEKAVNGPPPQGLLVESGDCFPSGQTRLPSLTRDANDRLAFTPPPGCSDDLLYVTSTLDVRSAVIGVQQEFYERKDSVHVVLMNDKTGDIGTELNIDGTTDDPALAANVPFVLHVVSHIPLESQLPKYRPTRRIFTSTVRVSERTSRGTSARQLVRPLVVRSQLYLNKWAENNNRATPTPAGASR
jgi:hypothetical protein